jgi:cytochrome c oxidase assembly protein Cox11
MLEIPLYNTMCQFVLYNTVSIWRRFSSSESYTLHLEIPLYNTMCQFVLYNTVSIWRRFSSSESYTLHLHVGFIVNKDVKWGPISTGLASIGFQRFSI